MRVRPLLVALAAAALFGGGFASSHLLEHSAQAQVSPLSSTVYIPSDGLVFRTFDGRIAARLTYGHHGGVFELYDEREAPSAVVRGPGAPRVATPPASRPRGLDEPDLGF